MVPADGFPLDLEQPWALPAPVPCPAFPSLEEVALFACLEGILSLSFFPACSCFWEAEVVAQGWDPVQGRWANLDCSQLAAVSLPQFPRLAAGAVPEGGPSCPPPLRGLDRASIGCWTQPQQLPQLKPLQELLLCDREVSCGPLCSQPGEPEPLCTPGLPTAPTPECFHSGDLHPVGHGEL